MNGYFPITERIGERICILGYQWEIDRLSLRPPRKVEEAPSKPPPAPTRPESIWERLNRLVNQDLFNAELLKMELEDRVQFFKNILQYLEAQSSRNDLITFDNHYFEKFLLGFGNEQYLLLPVLLERLKHISNPSSIFIVHYQSWISQITLRYCVVTGALSAANRSILKKIVEDYEEQLQFTQGNFQKVLAQLKARMSL